MAGYGYKPNSKKWAKSIIKDAIKNESYGDVHVVGRYRCGTYPDGAPILHDVGLCLVSNHDHPEMYAAAFYDLDVLEDEKPEVAKHACIAFIGPYESKNMLRLKVGKFHRENIIDEPRASV